MQMFRVHYVMNGQSGSVDVYAADSDDARYRVKRAGMLITKIKVVRS